MDHVNLGTPIRGSFDVVYVILLLFFFCHLMGGPGSVYHTQLHSSSYFWY